MTQLEKPLKRLMSSGFAMLCLIASNSTAQTTRIYGAQDNSACIAPVALQAATTSANKHPTYMYLRGSTLFVEYGQRTTGDVGEVRIYRPQGNSLQQIHQQTRLRLNIDGAGLMASANGQFFTTTENDGGTRDGNDPGAVTLFNVSQPGTAVASGVLSGQAAITGLTNDGQRIAVRRSAPSGAVEIYRFNGNSLVLELSVPHASAIDPIISPDGSTFAFLGYNFTGTRVTSATLRVYRRSGTTWTELYSDSTWPTYVSGSNPARPLIQDLEFGVDNQSIYAIAFRAATDKPMLVLNTQTRTKSEVRNMGWPSAQAQTGHATGNVFQIAVDGQAASNGNTGGNRRSVLIVDATADNSGYSVGSRTDLLRSGWAGENGAYGYFEYGPTWSVSNPDYIIGVRPKP